jgi:CheY-like chemotaxis protein
MNPSPRRFLVVDDEPLVRESIRKVLQLDGHTVEVAATGDEGLALFEKSHFDLVITDYEMPGMKGDKLVAAIKALRPLQPVIFISAYGDFLPSLNRPLDAADRVLSKPFRIEDLRNVIKQLLPKSDTLPGFTSNPGSAVRERDKGHQG